MNDKANADVWYLWYLCRVPCSVVYLGVTDNQNHKPKIGTQSGNWHRDVFPVPAVVQVCVRKKNIQPSILHLIIVHSVRSVINYSCVDTSESKESGQAVPGTNVPIKQPVPV